MPAYSRGLCPPTVKNRVRLQSMIVSADCQGLCPPTVKNYVRLQSWIMSAYSQGLCSPTVKDYVRLQSGTVSAYSQGICPLTVRDCVRLQSRIMSADSQGLCPPTSRLPTPPWTLHSLVLSAVVIHVVITAGLPAYFSTEDVISRGIICTCIDGSLQLFLLRPLGHPPTRALDCSSSSSSVIIIIRRVSLGAASRTKHPHCGEPVWPGG